MTEKELKKHQISIWVWLKQKHKNRTIKLKYNFKVKVKLLWNCTNVKYLNACQYLIQLLGSVIMYLFIAVRQHIPHAVDQKWELGPFLILFIPAFLHNLITATRATWNKKISVFLFKSCWKGKKMSRWQWDSHFIGGMGGFGHSVASLQSTVE